MNLLQLKASDPESSIWVSASAGTGKTKILVDRVLRLILQGEQFSKILCLTYTNAAAKEMQERVTSTLRHWSNLSDEELRCVLHATCGISPNAAICERARNLYQEYLQHHEPLSIYTIHSFGQKILQRFPLESGVIARFTILDEVKFHLALKRLRYKILQDPNLEAINEYLVENFHESIIDDIFENIIVNRHKFAFDQQLKKEEIPAIIQALNKGFDYLYEDIKHHIFIQNYIGVNITTRQLKSFFLTLDGAMKARILKANICPKGSSLEQEAKSLQQQIYYLNQQEKLLRNRYYGQLITFLAQRIIKLYESYKKEQNLLDYDDLIIRTCGLLNDSSARDWVLYKLDGFMHHVLVDEAQDTSMPQWAIIDAITKEFYSGDSALEEATRTIFVVGDEKQSIFSFQGADAEHFKKMRQAMAYNMQAAEKKFADVNLELSYRSAGAILDIVYNSFMLLQKSDTEACRSFHITPIKPFRDKVKGGVELWPLCRQEETEQEIWPITSNNEQAADSARLLAQKISAYIRRKLDSRIILPATGKPVSPGDFMILFRKRDQLTQEVIRALQEEKIAVSGLDRITLKDNMSVKDLIALAKFVLNIYDDLNLAIILKSPIIGLCERQLHDLIFSKAPQDPLWVHFATQANYRRAVMLLGRIHADYNKNIFDNFFQYLADMVPLRPVLNLYNEPDSNDAINQLIAVYDNYIEDGAKSLQKFILWVQDSSISIKRENNAEDAVQIMTVHGSKGLQAPIVILCDTTSLPSNDNDMLWDDKGELFMGCSASNASDYHNTLKEENNSRIYAEYLRLLYVAMTRAEDYLIICGHNRRTNVSNKAWYSLVRNAMITCGNQVDGDGDTDDAVLYYGDYELQEFGAMCRANSEHGVQLTDNYDNHLKRQRLSVMENDYMTSCYDASDAMDEKKQLHNYDPWLENSAVEYGIIFHKILEDAANARRLDLLNQHPLLRKLALPQRQRMQNSIQKIVANLEFISLLDHDFHTELSIGHASLQGEAELYRIDLLILKGDRVIIIDYKSDRNPPTCVEDIEPGYLLQLEKYQNMVAKLYKTKTVESKIMWLETGQLMSVDVIETS